MLKFKNTLVSFFLLAALFVSAQPAGYSYGKRIMIQASQVPGSTNLNNFTMLVSVTDNNLRNYLLGGHVRNANGYDILFTLTDCNTVLSHQIERYNPSTGELVAWVKVPSVSATINTALYMYYGNAAVTSNPSSSSTWNNTTLGRYHMNQTPNNSSLTDYSGNSNNSTSYSGNMGSSNQVAGKIGYGMSFNGSQMVNLGNNILIQNNFTMSAWIKSNQSDGNFHGFFGSNVGNDQQRSPGLWVIANTGLHYGRSTNGNWCSTMTGGGLITNGSSASWHYVTYVYNGVDQRLYVDGVLQHTNTNSCNSAVGYNQAVNSIGACDTYFTGSLDELSVSNTALSADWIAAEYANQNSPASFATFSTEYTAATLCGLGVLPVELTQFSAAFSAGANQTNITWTTAVEKDNAYFLVYKSKDAQNWTELGKVQGNGTIKESHHYFFADENPYAGITYYRLKQVDQNGESTFSDIISVTVETPQIFSAYPVPAKNELTVHFPEVLTNAVEVSLMNQMGQSVYTGTMNPGEQSTTLATSDLINGMYLLVVHTLDGKDPIFKKVIVQH